MIHDEEAASECAEDEEVEEEECLDLLRDLQEHVHKEASLAEDAEEVEYLEPHEEASNSLHRKAELC